jgi:hypothetical protein
LTLANVNLACTDEGKLALADDGELFVLSV